MKKTLDKFFDFLKFPDDEDDFMEDTEFYKETPPERNTLPERKASSEEEDENNGTIGFPKVKANTNRVSNPPKRKGNMGNWEVCRVSPTDVQDGRTITDYLIQGKVVLLDLEGIDVNLAQRIIDFASGATYAIDGTLQKVSNSTFVIAPSTVSVSGDFSETFDRDSSVTF